MQKYKSMIDYELLQDIKNKKKCTKYTNEYSNEFRIMIYMIRCNGLTYSGIREYCYDKYGYAPSRGHIKRLILDGEKLFYEKDYNTTENDIEEMNINNIENEGTEKGSFDLEKIKARISELLKDELTTYEKNELITSIVSLLRYIDKKHMINCG